ncbi:hypothetical protein [Listeria sp. ILCC792]|uniref:hypothetical protein n=1 Tax=Listeria sp. ILCC792 TaxID=1918331 RepID=UPI000B58D91C|nr:hypothetical protein [Listeria sp. ILCC792]
MKTETKILTKKKQPIKAITHQDIYKMKDTLEQLQSWGNVLDLLDKFFSCKQVPLNKKKIILEYSANAQIFSLFFENFLKHMNTLEKQMDELRTKEKIHV